MKLKTQFRTFSLARVAPDAAGQPDPDVIEFSFSSEEPVCRWFGDEILSHTPEAIDFSRLNNGANQLWNHDMNQVMGVIETGYLGADKRGYVKMRWATNPGAMEKRADVAAGIIRNVSFGYEIQEMQLQNPGATDCEPQYLATKWMPYEVSFVSVPADQTVGIGRAEVGTEKEVKILNEIPIKEKDNKMENIQIDAGKVRAEAIEAERARGAQILALGEKFAQQDLARQLIEGGKSIDEARAAVLEKVGAVQKPITGNEAVIGLSNKEARQYSFVKAMRAQMLPNDRAIQEDAAFEREVSDAAAKKQGKAARGMVVPVDVLRTNMQRDLTVGSSTAGGNLVATNLLSASFIDLLRNKSILQAAGATVMNGLQGSVAIPKQSGAATAYWVAESGAPTESAQTVAQVSMSPKTLGAYNDFSRKLILQSSIDVEAFVRNDLVQVLAIELDRVGLYGTGSSNQPQGIKAALAGGANESNFAGATPTFAEVVTLESNIAAANADAGAMKYIVNAAMRGALKTAVKVTGYPVYILENGEMNGYPVLMSNQVATGDVFFGDFSQLIMGLWSGLDLLVDPYGQASSGTVRVVALQDCDIALRHSESFARGNDTP